MRHTTGGLLIGFLLLAGCASPEYFYKPGIDYQQTERARQECRRRKLSAAMR